MRTGMIGLAAGAWLAAESHASAQQAATAPKAPPATVQGITVTGASQNGFRSSIDRRSYGVVNDLQATTGSVSDALKNIPSVEVDPQGAVSLRGDTNVTIMIDGKPSALFRGASAAEALRAMPADSVERVEVITNASAEFSPEGAVGIINLITKTTRKPGKSGSLRLNVGTNGRINGGGSAAYNVAKFTVTAELGGRLEPQDGSGTAHLVVFDSQGRPSETSVSRQDTPGRSDQWNGRVSGDYSLDAKTRLSSEIRYNYFDLRRESFQHLDGRDGAGVANLAFDARTPLEQSRGAGAIQATVRHDFSGQDHLLVLNVSRERSAEARDQTLSQTNSLPRLSDFVSRLRRRNTLTLTQYKADYTRPMGDAKLKAGYDLRIDQNDYNSVGLRGTALSALGPDPSQTNLFRYRQTINAAYATYERPVGDWTVLAGLRLEDVRLDLDQVTSNLINRTDDVHAYPSLHLAYRLSDDQQLIVSYSKRVQRPLPQDLNAFRVQNDPLNVNAGNPGLRPQLTDSFEAGYQLKSGGTFYLATLYYRHNQHGVTDVITPLNGGALLNTKANLGESKAAGLELVANGRVTKTLSYNISTNLYWNQIDARGEGLEQLIGFAGRRSAFAVGGRGSVTWQATPKDSFQFSTQVNAKRLSPQGYNDPVVVTFIGYRHKFDDSLSGVVTVQDVLNSFKFHGVIDTRTLHNSYNFKADIQAVFVGLTWSFGAANKRPRDAAFDFGGGGPTP